ncbi:MAG: FKBP-type peptidyl-prolyl cis-trans isomerase [Chitinophagales bacterium]|nr:FKBP-type peptidyl-prolyl cis-trans isomerase [Bacteroidota bacterium]MCB9226588.1 FKBP-type peptidyl-prolyl cis-trans isomerase [Chitinophagales bacterium]
MKKQSILLVLVVLINAIFFTSCKESNSKSNSGEVTLSNETDSLSYALGVNIGENAKRGGFETINYEAFAKGMEGVYSDNAIMTAEVAGTYINEVMMAKESAKAQVAKGEGEKFLAENAKKAGVVTTPSGLQYEVIKEGTGATPTAEDVVTVHYHGTLTDGTVFDSSVERGEPATFPLNQVIAGWTEGLQLMKEGAKYRFYIPSNLAYGDRAMGDVIKPGSTLIFDVELLKVGE